MKIAFCLFKYFPYGGMQRNALRIARALRARGHQVEFFAMQWQGDLDPDLPVHLLPARGLTNHTRYANFARAFALAAQGFDGRVGCNKLPGLDLYYAADTCYHARMAKRPFWHRLSGRYRAFIAAEQAVFSPQSHTEILAISDSEARSYQASYGTPASRFHALPPGIGPDRRATAAAPEQRARLRAEFGVGESEYLLLTIGSGFRMKGLDRSLRALAALPPMLRARTRLIAIGRDKPGPFRRLARKLGVAGALTILDGRDDVPFFLQGADLLLHPAYYENTGSVLVEAIVAGLPVLTTSTCGFCVHVQQSGCGTVLPEPFSQADMNQHLARMLVSPERARWREAGIAYGQTADLYSLGQTAAEVIETRLLAMHG